MNTFGENVMRVPNEASRRTAASARRSSRGRCSSEECGTSGTNCDTSGSPTHDLPLDELYASAPADFIATRAALVRRLRESGDAAGARELAQRRRPTQAAHAVNALARNEPTALAAYLDLSDRIRTAQVAAARDEDAREQLRVLDRERRTRLGALLDRAPEHRDEVERALAVALTDPDIADAARAGHLERIPDTAGGFATFGDTLGEPLPAPGADDTADAPRPPRPKPSAAETRRLARLAELDGEEPRADEALANSRAELKRAQDALRTAERHVHEAERARERLRTERERLER